MCRYIGTENLVFTALNIYCSLINKHTHTHTHTETNNTISNHDYCLRSTEKYTHSPYLIIKLYKLHTIDVEYVNNDYGTKLQVSSSCYWTMKQYYKYKSKNTFSYELQFYY